LTGIVASQADNWVQKKGDTDAPEDSWVAECDPLCEQETDRQRPRPRRQLGIRPDLNRCRRPTNDGRALEAIGGTEHA